MLGALVVPASGISVPENPSSLAGGSLRSPRRMSFSAAAVQSPGAASAVQTPGSAAASLYGVLRIDEDASPVEIKAAYRTLAKLYHPDADESEAEISSGSTAPTPRSPIPPPESSTTSH